MLRQVPTLPVCQNLDELLNEVQYKRITRQMQQAFQDMQEADLSELLDDAIQHSRRTIQP
ncbi:MAG: hypothetical protein RL122_2987 [Pseudomonadota bacterium]|uniref:Uncharacterized protein n=1 Tax=Thiothrix fructosivorans TaxID=111770 RepID=A0A8B0SIA6_9GAMM|nr:hypothetical protein [Thiothrix fructosivorans]MBO0611581.1 hypothetical protein [Thiothrix fructosivorans]QTX10754.1 hypothetical protein J1836_019690 [Thiothrix fructosivorans]